MYRNLDPEKVITTIRALRDRIHERFPESGLSQVAAELLEVSEQHAERSGEIRKPAWRYRVASVLLVAGVGALLVLVVSRVHPHLEDGWRWLDVIQTLESALSGSFFLGATLYFLMSLENRAKRTRCLRAIHEMRAMAHIVDMHQLTKDPERVPGQGADTRTSPKRTLTPFQLARYLDYCTEMLSLIGKLSALYAQGFYDTRAVAAVDEVENLTTALSSKIWQKILVLEQKTGSDAVSRDPGRDPQSDPRPDPDPNPDPNPDATSERGPTCPA